MGKGITIKSVMWKHQANKDGAYPVRVRITKNRKSKYKTIPHLVVKENQWATMEPVLNLLIEHLPDINEALKEVHDEKNKIEFFEYAWKWRERYNNEKNISFYRSSKALIKKFKLFIGDRTLFFHDINHSLILDYQAWLKQRRDKKGKLLNIENTRTLAIKRLRMIFRAAIKAKLVTQDSWPFDGIKMEKNNTIKQALTLPQLRAIRKVKLDKGSALWHYRNLFLLCFNTLGMRIADSLKMKMKHVENDKIAFSMGKSGDIVKITQTKEAMRIIKHYKTENPEDYLLPILDTDTNKTLFNRISSAEARVNKGLKKIATAAGIDVKVSSHIARHTWGELAMKNGVNMKIIQEAYGHSSVDTTENYTRGFGSDAVDEANKKVTSL